MLANKAKAATKATKNAKKVSSHTLSSKKKLTQKPKIKVIKKLFGLTFTF